MSEALWWAYTYTSPPTGNYIGCCHSPQLLAFCNILAIADCTCTVNRAAKVDKYPLPRIEDLFAALAGGTSFTKLDLAHAYQQIPLDADSRKFVTINTLKGLFQYTRLPFGVSSAPAQFQHAMENLLQGLPHVVVYIDDILVTGTTDAEHIANVEEVLRRLEAAGMRLKKSKCAFMLREVEYLGHRITAEELRPTPAKTQAIVSAPTPQNASQLKSFLGLVNYYAKFLPNLSNILAPLYALLQKQVEWSWGKAQEEASTALSSCCRRQGFWLISTPQKSSFSLAMPPHTALVPFSRKCWTTGLTGQWHSLRDLLPLLKSATPSLTRKAWQ